MTVKNPKRPIFVWVIFLYYLVTDALAAGGLFLVWHTASYSAQARTAIDSITTAGWTLVALTMVLELGGAIALFRLRSIAVPLFAAVICLAIVQMTSHLHEYSFSGAGSHSAYIVAFSLAIHFFVCAYAWRLRSRAVLV
jgi:hypothetical protein